MISLQPLERMGYTRGFFNLSPKGEFDRFDYYTFSDNLPQRQPGSWDMVGVHLRGEATEQIDIRLLHIEEEEVKFDSFHPLHDAGGFLSMTPSQLLALIEFFSTFLEADQAGENISITHFMVLDVDALQRLHVELWLSDRPMGKKVGNYFQYLPGEGTQLADLMSLVHLPHWRQSEFGESQASGLAFDTFDQQQLNDPFFKPFRDTWRGSMAFNRVAWHEFLALLKQHTYESSLNGMQS